MRLPLTPGLFPTVNLMNQMCYALARTEEGGMEVDKVYLNKLEEETDNELRALTHRLTELTLAVTNGHYVNLGSLDDLGTLLFSRRINKKTEWKTLWVGAGDKFKSRSRWTPKHLWDPKTFRQMVQAHTTVVRLEERVECAACEGKKGAHYTTVAGTQSKNPRKCQVCGGLGYTITYKDDAYGFKLVPQSPGDMTLTGFATSKEKLEQYAENAKDEQAREFLTSMVRFNALQTYKSTYLQGIRRAIRSGTRLHTNYMQAITKTGRISSQNPSFLNQPRGDTFPIRRCIISRWRGGKILKVDWKTLEFVVAAELSGDIQAATDIANPKWDSHNFTRGWLNKEGVNITRQEAKPHTFKPLYGGTSGTKAEREYYKQFLMRYPDIAKWHVELCEAVVRGEYITLPSGREYTFPGTKRYQSGSFSNGTKIKNYPVQGFATADIVVAAYILVVCALTDFKSIAINEVHDEIVVDVHPEEIEHVTEIVCTIAKHMDKFIKIRWNYDFKLPLLIEAEIGDNWLDTEELK